MGVEVAVGVRGGSFGVVPLRFPLGDGCIMRAKALVASVVEGVAVVESWSTKSASIAASVGESRRGVGGVSVSGRGVESMAVARERGSSSWALSSSSTREMASYGEEVGRGVEVTEVDVGGPLGRVEREAVAECCLERLRRGGGGAKPVESSSPLGVAGGSGEVPSTGEEWCCCLALSLSTGGTVAEAWATRVEGDAALDEALVGAGWEGVFVPEESNGVVIGAIG